MTITAREAFTGLTGLLIVVGVYLFWLWRPEHQVRLHTENFFRAIDGRNWERAGNFLGEDYHDRWENNRTRLIERMREGFRWVPGARITATNPTVRIQAQRAIWVGKIMVYSSDDGVMDVLDERVNKLSTPFEFEWRKASGKPWDWKLMRVSNPSFQIPAGMPY